MTSTTSRDLTALRTAMAGAVLDPGHAGYDEARNVWNADIDRRPAVIARCTSAQDVAAAVRFATAEGLEIAVRGGGAQLLGPERARRRAHDRPLARCARSASTPRPAGSASGGGCAARRPRRGHPGARARRARGLRQPHRGRRPHARRRLRLAHPHGRPDDRQPASPPRSSSPTVASVRASADEDPTVLGPPRRRWQLRRGHRVRVPLPPGRTDDPVRYVLLGSRPGRRGDAVHARPQPAAPARDQRL